MEDRTKVIQFKFNTNIRIQQGHFYSLVYVDLLNWKSVTVHRLVSIRVKPSRQVLSLVCLEITYR